MTWMSHSASCQIEEPVRKNSIVGLRAVFTTQFERLPGNDNCRFAGALQSHGFLQVIPCPVVTDDSATKCQARSMASKA